MAPRVDLAALDRRAHGAPGIIDVRAVREAALAEERAELGEETIQLVLGDGPQTERAEAGCIGEEAAEGERDELGVVWVPLPLDWLTSPTRRPRPGSRAFRSVDLPTPDGPTKALIVSVTASRSSSSPSPVAALTRSSVYPASSYAARSWAISLRRQTDRAVPATQSISTARAVRPENRAAIAEKDGASTRENTSQKTATVNPTETNGLRAARRCLIALGGALCVAGKSTAIP